MKASKYSQRVAALAGVALLSGSIIHQNKTIIDGKPQPKTNILAKNTSKISTSQNQVIENKNLNNYGSPITTYAQETAQQSNATISINLIESDLPIKPQQEQVNNEQKPLEEKEFAYSQASLNEAPENHEQLALAKQQQEQEQLLQKEKQQLELAAAKQAEQQQKQQQAAQLALSRQEANP